MITVESSSKGLGILEWFIFFHALNAGKSKTPQKVLTRKAAVLKCVFYIFMYSFLSCIYAIK